MKHIAFGGRMVIVGFGSIGQGVLPLLLRHIEIEPARIVIITADPTGRAVAAEYGVRFIERGLTPANHREILDSELAAGDFLVNVAVEVESNALIKLCREKDALYLDTCTEPWAGGYTDPSKTAAERTNYALRESALRLRRPSIADPTAVITHGANPGLVSHFLKRALLNLARDSGIDDSAPADRAGWAALMERLQVKVVHIAERDTQTSSIPKRPGEFVNTWSIDGFYGEGCQPAELGWGSHERTMPADGRGFDFGSNCAIYLGEPGATVKVRSWTPLEGPYQGFLITHGEAVSIADYYTVAENGAVRFRPTAHYAYHPCDSAILSLHELAGKNMVQQSRKRLLMDDIVEGRDELGVLLMGHDKGAYWYGSRLTMAETRKLAPHNNATSLQVTSAILAGVVWAIENPRRGVIEPEDMDFERILGLCAPYLGDVVGVYSDWTPLLDRERLFPEDIDRADPWQFKNFRVI